MHQVCRLYHKILYTIFDCTLKCLIHIVNLLVISCLYMIDDNLCCEGSSD